GRRKPRPRNRPLLLPTLAPSRSWSRTSVPTVLTLPTVPTLPTAPTVRTVLTLPTRRRAPTAPRTPTRPDRRGTTGALVPSSGAGAPAACATAVSAPSAKPAGGGQIAARCGVSVMRRTTSPTTPTIRSTHVSEFPQSAAGDTQGFALGDHIYNRLLKERIIWLGSEVRDENSNQI